VKDARSRWWEVEMQSRRGSKCI